MRDVEQLSAEECALALYGLSIFGYSHKVNVSLLLSHYQEEDDVAGAHLAARAFTHLAKAGHTTVALAAMEWLAAKVALELG